MGVGFLDRKAQIIIIRTFSFKFTATRNSSYYFFGGRLVLLVITSKDAFKFDTETSNSNVVIANQVKTEKAVSSYGNNYDFSLQRICKENFD